MATGSPFGPDCNGMDGDPEIWIRIRKIRFFRNFFFRFFWLLQTSWDLRVTPRMDRNHLIRIWTRVAMICLGTDREIRFFRTSVFFRLLKHEKFWDIIKPYTVNIGFCDQPPSGGLRSLNTGLVAKARACIMYIATRWSLNAGIKTFRMIPTGYSDQYRSLFT